MACSSNETGVCKKMIRAVLDNIATLMDEAFTHLRLTDRHPSEVFIIYVCAVLAANVC